MPDFPLPFIPSLQGRGKRGWYSPPSREGKGLVGDHSSRQDGGQTGNSIPLGGKVSTIYLPLP
jgi:hypothetical protein